MRVDEVVEVANLPGAQSPDERMVDVDGAPVLDGSVLYSTSFKGRTVAVDGPTGQIMWAQEHGGVGGVGMGATALVVSDAASRVTWFWVSTRSPRSCAR